MPSNELISTAINLVKIGRYRLTLHAENERDRDGITIKEVEECFFNGKMELLEDYPGDPRGHSFLALGYTEAAKGIHFVCAVHEEILIVITIYLPNSLKWKNLRERIK